MRSASAKSRDRQFVRNVKNEFKVKTINRIFLVIFFLVATGFAGSVYAEKQPDSSRQDMQMIMRFMNHGMRVALEGADMQMLGKMGTSRHLDKDAVVQGTIMVNDGKRMIKEMLEGKAMQEIYKEGSYDQKIMDDLHTLGDKMIEVIEQVEKLHKRVLKDNKTP